MIHNFCPECGIGLNTGEKQLGFCKNCKAFWDVNETTDEIGTAGNHICPSCGWQCSCSAQPCSCCEEDDFLHMDDNYYYDDDYDELEEDNNPNDSRNI